MKFDWVFLKFIHLEVNSDVNSHPFTMSFCRSHRLVLRQVPCKFGEVWLSTSKVIYEISVRFDWVFLKFIHLDVNSEVNFQPFTMWFCRHHRLVLRQLPCKFGEVSLTTPKVINAQHWANIVATSAERLLLISQSILNRFTCNFAHTVCSHYGDWPVNLKKFDQVFKKLWMWYTETTLFPRRQSAENAGRHWNSTE